MSETTAPENLLGASDDDLAAMGLPPAFTLEGLSAALSEAEIKALADGDDPLIALPDEDEDDDKGGEDDDDEDDDEDDGVDGDADGDDEDSDGGPAVDEQAAAVDETPAAVNETPDPVFTRADVTAAKAVIDGAAEQKRALRDAYNDGDLTDDEYDAKLEELTDKIADAKAEVKQAEKDDAASLKVVEDAWYSKVDRFLEANPAFKSNEALPQFEGASYLTMLDTALQSISRDQRYAAMTMDQRIAAGAEIVQAFVRTRTGEDMPGTTRAAKDKPTPKADPLKSAREKARKEGKRPDPVQTLANITAATENEVEDSRFAALDKADGVDAETAFARMSPAEQKAYLHGA